MSQSETKRERSWFWYWSRMLPKPAFILIPVLTIGSVALAMWHWEFALGLLGVPVALWTAHHAKVSHFLECFSRCNASYAALNGRLGQPSRSTHTSEEPAAGEGPGDAILDYFNLCAEEYVMHKMGVIPDFVWDVWVSGIHDIARQDHVKAAWDAEMRANCNYYGFDLQEIMRKHHKTRGNECGRRLDCPWYPMIEKPGDEEVQHEPVAT